MKPYYSLDAFFKNTYGEKIYKVAFHAGLTCPNRDGTIDTRGCIFCSAGGSGDFAVPFSCGQAFKQSLAAGKKVLSRKHTGARFIAYFQAYTNTYGPVSYLEEIYRTALEEEAVCGISIATRPDCLPPPVMSLLEKLKKAYPHKFIWTELGLQTIHEHTAAYIRRGFSLSCFQEAVYALHTLDIPVIAHLILGLPGETTEEIFASVSYLNALPVWGIKLQLLHVLKGTDLALEYEKKPEYISVFPTPDSYLEVLISCIERLRSDIVIHRVTGDAPGKLLIAPQWSADKRNVLNMLHKKMKEQSASQGRLYRKDTNDAGSPDAL